MNKKLGTYIGVCDFLTKEEVHDISRWFKTHEYSSHSQVQLMIGTMTSFKVLNGQETKWAHIFPKPENLKDIFSIKENYLINCIHYADYENNPGLCETLCKVVKLCGKGLDAIQLDIVWPDPKELALFKRRHDVPIILQVSKKAMTECADNPIAVAERLRTEYEDLISYVLFDCSMGKGIPLDVPLIEGYIQAITAKMGTRVKIAIAGGVGPDSVGGVRSLIEKYRVSIDAQSKLRRSGNAEDPIDWLLAKEYVRKVNEFYL